MGCAGEGSRTRRGGRPRPPGREELFTTAHTQQIPRTLLPRERSCERLGMTSPTILDSLIQTAYQYATSHRCHCYRGGFPSDRGVSRGIGVVMLVSPEAVSMTRGAPLLHGLELGGPYAALLVGAAWALIGWGLLRLYDWARLAAMLVIISGVGVLVARFALNASRFRSSLVWEGLEVFMRVAVVWYLFRTPVAEQFSKSARAT